MPDYAVGDLVRPAGFDEDPNVVGLVFETRHMMHMRPEVKVTWSDMPGQAPKWTYISDVLPLETEADG